MKNINPTTTKAWRNLQSHFHEIKKKHLSELFKNDVNRKERLSIEFDDVIVDFSNNRITNETVKLLLQLAKEVHLDEAIKQQFSGDKINITENRAVLHTALRDSSTNSIFVNQEDIKPQINRALKQMKLFSDRVISGEWKGFTGKTITDIVNIGIGGSDLGPNMVVDALQFYKNHLTTHFVSNVDGDHVSEIIKHLNPETTLFVIVSKTFTTQETLTNALTIKKWFLQTAQETDIPKHFIAVSTNHKAVAEFGIEKENVFPMWNWVGGRFSLWSSVGISISLSIGFENFKELLSGANKMDSHFKHSAFHENIPVLLAMIAIWYTNFFDCETEAILPYSQYLNKFPDYLQQASMESNGKSVDRNGDKITYQTGTIIWGSTGTNMQHAFMQLVHQGTKLIPTDFIGFSSSLHGLKDHHEKLLANLHGQIEALAFGKNEEEVHLELKYKSQTKHISKLLPFKVFEGNKPSNLLLFTELTPEALGRLIALYEHKIFVQGVVWNIFSYDQFGVELGKELANKRLLN